MNKLFFSEDRLLFEETPSAKPAGAPQAPADELEAAVGEARTPVIEGAKGRQQAQGGAVAETQVATPPAAPIAAPTATPTATPPVTPPATPAAAPTATPTATPAAAPAVAPLPEVDDNERSLLSKILGDKNPVELMKKINEGKLIEKTEPVNFPMTAVSDYEALTSEGGIKALGDEIKKCLEAKFLKDPSSAQPYKDLLKGFTSDEVADTDLAFMLSRISAKNYLEQAQGEFAKKCPYFKSFVEAGKIPASAKMTLTIKNGVASYVYDSDMVKEYNAYVKSDDFKNLETKPATLADEKGAVDVQGKVEELKKHPFGKFLGMFGDGVLTEIASGKAPFLAFLAGMFGVKMFEKNYDFIRGIVPKQWQSKLDDWQKKGKAKLDENKDKIDKAAEAKEGLLGKESTPTDVPKLDGSVRSTAASGKDGYLVGEKGLTVDQNENLEPYQYVEVRLNDGEIHFGSEMGPGQVKIGDVSQDLGGDKKTLKAPGTYRLASLPAGTSLPKGARIVYVAKEAPAK